MAGLQYTQVPSDTFEKLQLNAGILVDEFTPSTGVIGNILGATSGGINFASNPSFTDFGEDIDNVPNNMMELKHLQAFDPVMSGTFLTVTAEVAQMLVGAADIAGGDSTKVIPRQQLLTTDFTELWWIGDYSDKNTGATAGFIAIHLLNALNTTGFQIQSTKDGKGTMSFEFHGHYSIDAQDTVPFEIYVKAGMSGSETPSVRLNNNVITVVDETTAQLTATVVPAGSSVTWSSSNTAKATVSDGLVTGKDAGNCIITAAITVDGVTYNDTCTVIVTAS
ncbi:MAG: Ig-like domain-containing protein [Methanomicrobium sp.]|nr:Ig-like domain-containing protein [Methanomicrobium sp.]